MPAFWNVQAGLKIFLRSYMENEEYHIVMLHEFYDSSLSYIIIPLSSEGWQDLVKEQSGNPEAHQQW